MKKVFRKYEFGSQGAASTKINALGLDDEGNPTHSHSIVRLGHIVTTKGTYDEEGNELTAPVLSDSYHVDVLWNGEPDPDWDAQMVWCAPMGFISLGLLALSQSGLLNARCSVQSFSLNLQKKKYNAGSGHISCTRRHPYVCRRHDRICVCFESYCGRGRSRKHYVSACCRKGAYVIISLALCKKSVPAIGLFA